LIDTFLPGAFGLAPPPVVILDTKAAINAACHLVNWGRPGRLERAIGHGVPVFIPRHVLNEVGEHLETRSVEQGLDPGAVSRTWTGILGPYIRVVDLDIRDHLDLLLRPVVAEDDADDLATAALALFLAPAVVFSDDHHLVDHGFAGRDWWVDTALDVVFMAIADEQVMSLLVGFNITTNGLTLGLGAGIRFAARQPLVAILVAAAILAGATLLVRRYPLAPKLKEIGGAFVSSVETTFAFRQEATARLPLVTAPRWRTPALEQRCARALARATGALSVENLRTRLLHDLALPAVSDAEIRRALRGHPAFVEVAPGRWQLGSVIATGRPEVSRDVPASWRPLVPLGGFDGADTGAQAALRTLAR
jgi:hypothetical protein